MDGRLAGTAGAGGVLPLDDPLAFLNADASVGQMGIEGVFIALVTDHEVVSASD